MYVTLDALLSAAESAGSIGAAVALCEAEDSGISLAEVRERMHAEARVMREGVARGRAGKAMSRSGLVGGDSLLVAEGPAPFGSLMKTVVADALAVAEVNASMGRIVAAPTAGSCGVVPGVLVGLCEEFDSNDDDLVDALFAAAGIGGIINARATFSGAAAGCQAEVGSAAAMAAAAATQLCGGTPEQAGHAASLALQGLLGLVCDPIGGLVEVPCVVRNATGASVALAATQMALADVKFPVPFDQVAEAMAVIGEALPVTLRETSLGGLAVTPAGRDLAEQVDRTGSVLAHGDRER